MSSYTSLELLTIEQVAGLLLISQRGVRRLLDKKLVPFYRVMGSIRIDKKDILSYLESNRTEGSTTVENELAEYETI